MAVRTEKHGDLLVITIDRPEVRNAVDHETAVALAEAFRSFDGDRQRTACVLTGAGGTSAPGPISRRLPPGAATG